MTVCSGALVVSGGRVGGAVFPYLLLLNPADVFRVLNVHALGDVGAVYGLATVFPPELANDGLLYAVMLAWCVAPLLVAAWRFRR